MKQLSNTDLKVSPLCLGTGQFGTGLPDDDANRQLDIFFDRGGNFIDTAHVYGDWGDRGTGLSERIIGAWLQKRRRSDVVLATKGTHPRLQTMDRPRLDENSINEDLEGSLRGLQTDYIDLYFLHRDDPSLPVEEILAQLEAARKLGKIRYYGCSNWRLERLAQAQRVAQQKGWKGFVCNQLMWSMADINSQGLADSTMVPIDNATFAYHRQSGLNAMAYMSIANGYFSKRAKKEAIVGNAAALYHNQSNEMIFEYLSNHLPAGYTMMDISLLYFMRQPFPAIPIASFSREAQLLAALDGLEKAYPDLVMEAVCKLKTLKDVD